MVGHDLVAARRTLSVSAVFLRWNGTTLHGPPIPTYGPTDLQEGNFRPQKEPDVAGCSRAVTASTSLRSAIRCRRCNEAAHGVRRDEPNGNRQRPGRRGKPDNDGSADRRCATQRDRGRTGGADAGQRPRAHRPDEVVVAPPRAVPRHLHAEPGPADRVGPHHRALRRSTGPGAVPRVGRAERAERRAEDDGRSSHRRRHRPGQDRDPSVVRLPVRRAVCHRAEVRLRGRLAAAAHRPVDALQRVEPQCAVSASHRHALAGTSGCSAFGEITRRPSRPGDHPPVPVGGQLLPLPERCAAATCTRF